MQTLMFMMSLNDDVSGSQFLKAISVICIYCSPEMHYQPMLWVLAILVG